MLASLEMKLAASVGILLVLFLAGLGCYEYGKSAQRAGDILANAVIINAARTANDKLKQQLELDHAKAENTIAALKSTPVPRVYIRSSCGKGIPAKSGVSSVPASGVLPTETERILDADRQRTWDNIAAAEQELEDCRIVKHWAEKLPH